MTTPVIIKGYCLTYNGGKNTYVPGFFTNGTKKDPVPLNFGIKGGNPAGHIIRLEEEAHGLWVEAEIPGGRDALDGYDGLSVALVMNHWIKSNKRDDCFKVYNVDIRSVNIVKRHKRKDALDAVDYQAFSIKDIETVQVDLFGEAAE